MGTDGYKDVDYTNYTRTIKDKPKDAVFKRRELAKGLDPRLIKNGIRESRDTASKDPSTPIIVCFDQTGSMGEIPDYFVREGMGILFRGIYDRKPITDPHVMVAAYGDMVWLDNKYGRAPEDGPLQVSQFEAAANPLIKQVEKIYLEGKGGGNRSESTHAIWYFAARHTVHDAWEKRGKKGFIFTIGDEGVPPPLTKAEIEYYIGDKVQQDFSAEELLAMASKTYHVYHLAVGHTQESEQREWKKLMGQNLIPVSDHTKFAEVIISILQVMAGEDKAKVANSWKGGTSLVVRDAIDGLTPTTTNKTTGSGARAL